MKTVKRIFFLNFQTLHLNEIFEQMVQTKWILNEFNTNFSIFEAIEWNWKCSNWKINRNEIELTLFYQIRIERRTISDLIDWISWHYETINDFKVEKIIFRSNCENILTFLWLNGIFWDFSERIQHYLVIYWIILMKILIKQV